MEMLSCLSRDCLAYIAINLTNLPFLLACHSISYIYQINFSSHRVSSDPIFPDDDLLRETDPCILLFAVLFCSYWDHPYYCSVNNIFFVISICRLTRKTVIFLSWSSLKFQLYSESCLKCTFSRPHSRLGLFYKSSPHFSFVAIFQNFFASSSSKSGSMSRSKTKSIHACSRHHSPMYLDPIWRCFAYVSSRQKI